MLLLTNLNKYKNPRSGAHHRHENGVCANLWLVRSSYLLSPQTRTGCHEAASRPRFKSLNYGHDFVTLSQSPIEGEKVNRHLIPHAFNDWWWTLCLGER